MNDDKQSRRLSLSTCGDFDYSSQTLVCLLKPGATLTGSAVNFSYASGNIAIRARHRLSTLERLFFSSLSDLAEFEVEVPGPSCIGFSSSLPGAISVQEVSTGGLFVIKNSFLCASSSCDVTPTLFPVAGDPFVLALQSPGLPHHSVYFISRSPRHSAAAPSLVFLQLGETVLEKTLVDNETFIVNLTSLCGFSETVSLTLQPIDFLNTSLGVQLLVKGPGKILLSGAGRNTDNSSRPRSSGDALGRRYGLHVNNHLVLVVARLLAFSVGMALLAVLLSKLVDLDIDIQQYQQQQQHPHHDL